MFAGLRSVWVLLLGVAILSLGHGLHGSLVGVRASAENFDAGTTGLIMSGYFAGLLVSSSVTPRIVQSVGHIRLRQRDARDWLTDVHECGATHDQSHGVGVAGRLFRLASRHRTRWHRGGDGRARSDLRERSVW